MSKPSKGGRTPISVKQESMDSEFLGLNEDISLLTIDEGLRKELEGKGYAFRWINAAKFRGNGNFHQSGWRPYKKTLTEEEKGSLDFMYGVSPEGYLIRNDLLLAVKPKEHQEQHSRRVKAKADRMAGKSEENVKEFRERARSAGAKVLEGYEENE